MSSDTRRPATHPLAAGSRVRGPAPKAPALSHDHVVWAYRLFLDREPESDPLIEGILREIGTTPALRRKFVSSEEFRLKNPDLSPSNTNAELVRWAYRLFLDREPESEQQVSDKVHGCKTTEDLRRDFMSSPEFLGRNPSLQGLLPAGSVVIKELAPGLRLFVDLSDLAIGANIVRELYERSELAFIRDTVRLGDSVVDVGANIGYFTMHLAAVVGAAGRVQAYEPLETNAELLERSLHENHFGDRVTLRRAAVGAAPGEIRLAYVPLESGSRNSGGGFLLEDGREIPYHHEIVSVPVVCLDQEEIRRPVRFIKIDIEGAEPLAFRGARDILANDRPLVLSEINPINLRRVGGCSPGELLMEMRQVGYECLALENGRPGRVIHDVSGGEVTSVVFRPLDRRA